MLFNETTKDDEKSETKWSAHRWTETKAFQARDMPGMPLRCFGCDEEISTSNFANRNLYFERKIKEPVRLCNECHLDMYIEREALMNEEDEYDRP